MKIPYIYDKVIKRVFVNDSIKKNQFQDKLLRFRFTKKDATKILNELEKTDYLVKENKRFPFFKIKKRVLNNPYPKDLKLG